MEQFFSYIKSCLVIFLIITVLDHMIPGEKYRKYVQFFSRLVLVMGILYPCLVWSGESDRLLQKIQADAFWQKLEEIQINAENSSFFGTGEVISYYEKAVEADISQIVLQENMRVKEISVDMTEAYEIEKIRMVVEKNGEDDVVIGKIVIDGQPETKEDEAYRELKRKLIGYYQLSEDQLELIY